MQELTLTREAAAALYSASTSLIIGANLMSKYRRFVPEGISIFALQGNGVVSLESEKNVGREASIPFIGLPSGLLGFAISRNMKHTLVSFMQFSSEQSPRFPPDILILSRFGVFGKKQLLEYMNAVLSRDLAVKKSSLSGLERQLVALRGKHETLSFAYEKARRMIVGAGYSTRTISFDLSPGAKSIGPQEVGMEYSYQQVLPVDLVSFTGVSLFVSREAAGTDGVIKLAVRRRSDNAIIGAAIVPYASFLAGWHRFSFETATGLVVGDGILQLEWHGVDGPSFAFADEVADRFGALDSSTLALRVETGLAEPSCLFTHPTLDSKLTQNKMEARALYERGAFLGGQVVEEEVSTALGTDVLKLDTAGRWLQVHALKKQIAAIHLTGVLPVHSVSILADVILAHRKAAPCIAFLAVGPAATLSPEKVANIFKRKGEAVIPSGCEGDIQWVTKYLTPGGRETIRLTLEAKSTTEQDLILGVIPAVSGKNDRAWCRWHQVTLTHELSDIAAGTEEIPQELLAQARQNSTQIRVHRFTEIMQRIEYYNGKQSHASLHSHLGFWPVAFSDDTDAMQLNPLREKICAVRLLGGLPENVRRISCEVGTAHSQADDFIYVIGTAPADESLSNAVEDVVAQIGEGNMCRAGQCDITWSAVRLKAREKYSLELLLEQPSKSGQEVFFATLPVADSQAEYGWCRWYSVAFEMLVYDSGVTTLEAESLKRIRSLGD